jgi:hypothetical protein
MWVKTMEHANKHRCKKTVDKGMDIRSYYDREKNEKVYYCHYCGERVEIQNFNTEIKVIVGGNEE